MKPENQVASFPILLYHQVERGDPRDIHAVSVRNFADQMQWLSDCGYKTAPFHSDGPPGTKAGRYVVLTFDDGYLGAYAHAFPLLKQFAFTATFFLVADRVGKRNDWDAATGQGGAALMDWEHVLDMQADGMHFGAHTCTHPDLLSLPADQAGHEIRDSRTMIADRIGAPVDLFSYPYSRYDASTIELVAQAGFDFACDYRPGYVGGAGDQLLALRRTGVLAADSLDVFKKKVRAALPLRARYLWRRIRSRWTSRLSA